MAVALSEFGRAYAENLRDLTVNDRRTIATLKDLAFENPGEAPSVVHALRTHIKTVGCVLCCCARGQARRGGPGACAVVCAWRTRAVFQRGREPCVCHKGGEICCLCVCAGGGADSAGLAALPTKPPVAPSCPSLSPC